MEIDNAHCFSRYDLKNIYFKSKLVDHKGAKIDDVIVLSADHVLSPNNGDKYNTSKNMNLDLL